MKRGDAAVVSVSIGLAVVVVAAVVYSQFFLDRSPVRPNSPGVSVSSLLVMTWGPSLCEVEVANPGCRSGHVGQLGPTLILHGLWPQPKSQQLCGVPKSVADRAGNTRGNNMPPVDLPRDVQARLQTMMSDAAIMAPHEWYTHGTCSGLDPTDYFTLAASFADQVGRVLDPVLVNSRGKRLSPGKIRDAIDTAFGRGAGDRVGGTCRTAGSRGSVTYEVQLSLPTVIEMRSAAGTSVGQWLSRGPVIAAGCGQGVVP